MSSELEFLATECTLVGPMLDISNEQVERLAAAREKEDCLKSLRLSSGDSATRYCFKGFNKIDQVDSERIIWITPVSRC